MQVLVIVGEEEAVDLQILERGGPFEDAKVVARAPLKRDRADVEPRLGLAAANAKGRVRGGPREPSVALLEAWNPARAHVDAVEEIEFDLERAAAIGARIAGRGLGDGGLDLGAALEERLIRSGVFDARALLHMLEIAAAGHLVGGDQAVTLRGRAVALHAHDSALGRPHAADWVAPAQGGVLVGAGRAGASEAE